MKSGLPERRLVGQVADDGLFARGRLDFAAQVFRHAHLLAVPIRVRIAVLLHHVAFPLGALREDHQRVVARIVLLVGHQQLDEVLQADLVLRDAAPQGGDEGGVERGVAGVASKHAEHADALVRADRGALPVDGVHGACDGGRKADAVLGIAHVVVHGLGHGDDLHALPVQLRRVAQRIVAADGHHVIQVQRLDVFLHRPGHVERLGGDALLGGFGRGELLALQNRRELLHLGGAGARAVQPGAAGAVDGARVLAVQRLDIPGAAGRIL